MAALRPILSPPSWSPATVSRSSAPATTPHTAGTRVLFPLNSLIGASVLSLLLSYLVQIYSSLRERNTLAAAIDLMTGGTGDDTPPGAGTKKLAAITMAARIAPAGRFVASPGEDMDGSAIVWIDYGAAIALHRASDRKPGMGARSRAERLTGTTPAARRVSLGCINVSTAFYDRFIATSFSRSASIAYIMPETRSATVQFSMLADSLKTSLRQTGSTSDRSACWTVAPRDIIDWIGSF